MLTPPASRTRLAMRYAAFAGIATALNLAAQALSLAAYGGALALPLAMVIGTAVGLVAKFELDRRWIFYVADRARTGTTFLGYAGTGVLTTAIFWCTEIAAHLVSGIPEGKYVGGAIGLAVGYVIKFTLDRDYVFTVKLPRSFVSEEEF